MRFIIEVVSGWALDLECVCMYVYMYVRSVHGLCSIIVWFEHSFSLGVYVKIIDIQLDATNDSIEAMSGLVCIRLSKERRGVERRDGNQDWKTIERKRV